MANKRQAETSPRLSSGIRGLDEMIRGGFLPGDATLVAGSPGTGKTTMGLHFIAAGVAAGDPGVFVTFEYLPQQIYRDAQTRGWPLKQWEEEGLVRLICTTPEALLASDASTMSILDESIADIGARRLVIDSMAHFEFTELPRDGLRKSLAGLVNHLRLLGVTTMMTHELPQIVGPTVSLSSWGLEFLADNVILLRYVELDGELQKAITVLKFRGGDHDRTYRSFNLTGSGLVVSQEFKGVENISSGAARRSVAERAAELV